MIKVAGYCRVSTDKEDQANSFDSQQRYFREYIQNRPDWKLYEIYADEGITGTSTKKRPQFNRMISDAYDGKFRMIITKEVSRFSRNILDTISYTRELKSIGIGVIFLTDRINTLDPESEMLLSFLASLAQEESRRTSSRVVWGQTRQMERGIVFGPSLLGYDVEGGKITVNPHGAEIVRLIFQKYALEQIGPTEIARILERKGIYTYTGNRSWTTSSVVKILNNEKYAGDLVQKKTYTPDFLTHEKRANKGSVPLITIENHHEPIISREVWNIAQERLKKNNKHSTTACGHSNRYVFSGKIKCGECGGTFVSRLKYRKDGNKVRRWGCSTAVNHGKAACGIGMLIKDDDAIQMLKTAIKSLPVNFSFIISNTTALAADAVKSDKVGYTVNPQQLQIEIKHLKKKKEAVMDSFFSQEISREDMQSMNQKYNNRLELLYQELKKSLQGKEDSQNIKSLRLEIESEVEAILSGERASEVFFKNVLDRLTVFKDRHIELRLRNLPQIFQFTEEST